MEILQDQRQFLSWYERRAEEKLHFESKKWLMDWTRYNVFVSLCKCVQKGGNKRRIMSRRQMVWKPEKKPWSVRMWNCREALGWCNQCFCAEVCVFTKLGVYPVCLAPGGLCLSVWSGHVHICMSSACKQLWPGLLEFMFCLFCLLILLLSL